MTAPRKRAPRKAPAPPVEEVPVHEPTDHAEDQPVPVPGVPNDQQPAPVRRGIVTIAVIGLVGATGGSIGGLVYAIIVNGASTDALSTIASIGVGSLATLAGTRQQNPPPPTT